MRTIEVSDGLARILEGWSPEERLVWSERQAAALREEARLRLAEATSRHFAANPAPALSEEEMDRVVAAEIRAVRSGR